jgi:hypothetical protein
MAKAKKRTKKTRKVQISYLPPHNISTEDKDIESEAGLD